MLNQSKLSADNWEKFAVNQRDIEFLHSQLFEKETPLTPHELSALIIEERLRAERDAELKKREERGKAFLPKEKYNIGDALTFPALNWKAGKIANVRPGVNPEAGTFDVIEVDFEDSSHRSFAANLQNHKLNTEPVDTTDADSDFSGILEDFGAEIEVAIEAALKQDGELVRIAGRWFPRALLVDVPMGHLNIAEAVLEESGGEPKSAELLAQQIELPARDNPKLIEFSLNYALQEDGRFDEVGPAGQVLWCLKRLEPEDVRNVPTYLRYQKIDFDRNLLDKQMIALENELDDELTDYEHGLHGVNEAYLSLTYPHWRSGTLPISKRLKNIFPTAYESPHVRFTLVDGKTGERIPAWVVREHRYVSGLKNWFEKNKIIPGALITIRRSKNAGEIIIEAKTRRPAREWVRTVIAGSDGGLVFALLKQDIACEFNERMTLVAPDPTAVDKAREHTVSERISLEKIVTNLVRELAKLTPQGHVHAQELYAALNIIQRVPPAPLFALLSTAPGFTHVGDMHYRIADSEEN